MARPARHGSFVWALCLTIIAFQNMKAVAQEPRLAPNTVANAIFHLKTGQTFSAGKVFAVKLSDGQSVILSCAHLFGPAGGLDKPLQGLELQKTVQCVDLISTKPWTKIGEAGKELLSDSHSSDWNKLDCRGDLVAFRITRSPLSPLALSNARVTAGTKAWLITEEATDPPSGQEVIAGKVTECATGYTNIKLEKPLVLRACSGSPVVDVDGKLIGVLIGASKDGQEIILHPVNAISEQLKQIAKPR